MSGDDDNRGIVLSAEQKRRQRSRNLALAWSLAAFVVIVLVVTIVRLGGHVATRPF